MLLSALLLALHLQPVLPPEPNRQPQLAAANGEVMLVFGSGDSIWLARSSDNGRSFDKPARVAVLPKLLLGRHRGPRVVISGGAFWSARLPRAATCTAGDPPMPDAPGRSRP